MRKLLMVLGAAVLLAGSAWAQGAPEAAAGAEPPAEAARAALAKWVETERILAKEQADWQRGREIIRSRIEVVRAEVAELEEKLKQIQAGSAELDQKRAELSAEDAGEQAASTARVEWAAELESGVKDLHRSFPEPLQEKVRPLFQRLPAEPARTGVSAAERFQNVVAILNEAGKFNGEITMATEVRTLADGKPSEVRTIYLGLGQAYFLSARGEAGFGLPAQDGWRWQLESDLAPRLLETVEILQNKAAPRFIPLPVKLQ